MASNSNLSRAEQLILSTVRLECASRSGLCTGTGFFFEFPRTEFASVPVIITNRHVVEGCTSGTIHLHEALNPSPKLDELRSHKFDIPNFGQGWYHHPNPAIDLSMLPLLPFIEYSQTQGIDIFYRGAAPRFIFDLETDSGLVDAIENVLMVGYPDGLWDTVHNMPILRTGLTATSLILDYCGRSEFVIDAACFPGSSGSPVYLLDRVGVYGKRNGEVALGGRMILLGILYGGPVRTSTGEVVVMHNPSKSRSMAVMREPINLGYVIKAKEILGFESIVKSFV